MATPKIKASHSDRFFKVSLGILACFGIIWILLETANSMIGIVILFGLSLVFTYILLAPVNLVEYLLTNITYKLLVLLRLGTHIKKLPKKLFRVISILLVYCLFSLTILVASVRFVPAVSVQLNQFANQFPKYVNQVEEWILTRNITQNYFHQEVSALKNEGQISKPLATQIDREFRGMEQPEVPLTATEKKVIREKVFATSSHFNAWLKENMGKTLSDFTLLISNTLTGVVYAFTGLVLVFYFLLDGKSLKQGLVDMLPRESKNSVSYLLESMHAVMFGFIKGQVMLGALTGAYMIVIYSIFGVPYALFLGAFFAIAEILPVVGTWLGFLPGILVLLFINPVKLLMVMACVYIFQVIKDNILAPRVIGHVMGLHPVIVILSLLICAKVAGLVGVLFAIPLASGINVLIRFLQHEEMTD